MEYPQNRNNKTLLRTKKKQKSVPVDQSHNTPLSYLYVASSFYRDMKTDVNHFQSSWGLSGSSLPPAVYHITNQIISTLQETRHPSHRTPKTPHWIGWMTRFGVLLFCPDDKYRCIIWSCWWTVNGDRLKSLLYSSRIVHFKSRCLIKNTICSSFQSESIVFTPQSQTTRT